ncbi:MAG TPA: HdeD family acid-resistance protein, partial [Candidatus Udaeobacter sp.]|nr:HdeD family acid-resistance protein [Candidatus Udaeobacter sp.]
MLLETLKHHWWVPVLRGVVAIIFGIMAFAYPGLTLAVLVILFGAWVLVDGIFRIIGAIGHRSSDPDWGWQLVIGILGIIIGFLTFHAPAITALALVIYIAAWALMIGVSEIVIAIKLRQEIKGEWFLILMGVVSILFAIMLLWNPLPGALALVWLIASYAI